jgi:hypothetical protein
MNSCGGKLAALAGHPTKKADKASELTFLFMAFLKYFDLIGDMPDLLQYL